MSIQFDAQHLSGFISKNEYTSIAPQVKLAHDMLHSGTGMGNEFIGWVRSVFEKRNRQPVQIKNTSY